MIATAAAAAAPAHCNGGGSSAVEPASHAPRSPVGVCHPGAHLSFRLRQPKTETRSSSGSAARLNAAGEAAILYQEDGGAQLKR